ncbi:MAG: endonuclease [Desulfuromonadaceae bacterium GWB2_53_15]|nr:MAG: endonuclease [Desulfuromonadaceae bacterium GWB2_53_15]
MPRLARGAAGAPRPALLNIFNRLLDHYGPLQWWPAETPFEVCVGAILTQNTNWSNVEKAISALKQADVLTPEGLRTIEPDQLAFLIRPSGFFNVKSRRLKEFIAWFFDRYDGSLERMFAIDWRDLRGELLKVRGIGPETCDSILLYAGGQPTFVVDAYTRRLFHRLGMLNERADYEETRSLFMANLPADAALYNEYHALIVEHCKRFCRSKPLCDGCPLASGCCCYLVKPKQ